MKIKLCCPILVLTAYCFLSTALYAQDFSLELMKSRASLDKVIMEAGPKYHKIKAQADSISDAIEKLREELHKIPSPWMLEGDKQWEVSFRRKIVCIDISIKALGAEIKKYLCMGTAI